MLIAANVKGKLLPAARRSVDRFSRESSLAALAPILTDRSAGHIWQAGLQLVSTVSFLGQEGACSEMQHVSLIQQLPHLLISKPSNCQVI